MIRPTDVQMSRRACLFAVALLLVTPSASAQTALDTAQTIWRLTNRERAAAGLPALAWNQDLADAAQKYAGVLASGAPFSHTGADRSTPGSRVTAEGYTGWQTVGENIAKGYPTADSVMAGWMGSSGHKANILSRAYNEVGVGVAGVCYVQDFGYRPNAPAPAPTPSPVATPAPQAPPTPTGAPRIDQVTPARGPPGTRVTVTGVAFSAAGAAVYVIWPTRDGAGVRLKAERWSTTWAISTAPATVATGTLYLRRVSPSENLVSNRINWTTAPHAGALSSGSVPGEVPLPPAAMERISLLPSSIVVSAAPGDAGTDRVSLHGRLRNGSGYRLTRVAITYALSDAQGILYQGAWNTRVAGDVVQTGPLDVAVEAARAAIGVSVDLTEAWGIPQR